MNIEINDEAIWSETVFGQCSLGDKRLTKRLVQMGRQLSNFTGTSLVKSCEGQEHLIEGSYRLLRNKRVTADAIATGGYESTARIAENISLLLAIEDTTTLSYSHTVKKELGPTSTKADARTGGYVVHTTMLMDAEQEKTVGLIAQERWCRDSKAHGKKHQRGETAYEEKESYKWEKNTHQLERRLGAKLSDVISVCDREADIYEYIRYKRNNNQRFVVRASHNRQLENSSERLKEHLSTEKILGCYTIEIEQKKGRKKRQVEIELKAKTITFSPPKAKKGIKKLPSITLNVVLAQEKNPNKNEGLEWILLTTEAIGSFEEVRKITRYYELRWRVEDFHKAWKSGTGVERQRMQSADNLEKMVVILSFVAIRLLQLKEYFEGEKIVRSANDVGVSCDQILQEVEWKVLWKTVEKKELPADTPSAAWAYKTIAKLGGWNDSKKTGKASWSAIWDGWFRLSERVEGFRLAQQLGNI